MLFEAITNSRCHIELGGGSAGKCYGFHYGKPGLASVDGQLSEFLVYKYFLNYCKMYTESPFWQCTAWLY